MGSLDLPKEQWKRLANAIEEKLNNQTPFSFEKGCPEVENLAAHYARMILSKSLNQAAEETAHDRAEVGHCVYARNTISANLSQKSIYDGLGIKHDPLKNVYFKRKIENTARM